MKKQSQPGDLYNKFQKKKIASTKFIPTYGGKAGGKMSNGSGWGGEAKPGAYKINPASVGIGKGMSKFIKNKKKKTKKKKKMMNMDCGKK